MPILPPSSLVVVSTAVTVVLILAYCALSAAKASKMLRPAGFATMVALGLFGWLFFTGILARLGVFAYAPGRLPLEPLLPVSFLVTFILLGRTKFFGLLLKEIPLWQPVALETFRIGIEVAFWLLFREGHAPIQVTFEGRNLDVLAGLSAPIVAILVACRLVTPRWLFAWNALCVGLLLNAVFTVATSSPGPQHLNWPGEPFTALGQWPIIWIPAMFVPLGLFLHIVSIQQTLRVLTSSRSSRASQIDVNENRFSGSSPTATIGGHRHVR